MKNDTNITDIEKGADVNEIIDIEENSKSGKAAPAAKRYRIRIDKNNYEVSQPTITGHELLILAAKQPIERFAVYQKVKGGGTERIALDQAVDLRTPGLERFVTLPLDQTEGGR